MVSIKERLKNREEIELILGIIILLGSVLLKRIGISSETCGFVITLFILSVAIILTILIWKNNNKYSLFQLLGISILAIYFALLWNVYAFYTKKQMFEDIYAVISACLGIFVLNLLACSAIIILFSKMKNVSFLKIKDIIWQHKEIIVLMIIFSLGALPALGALMTNDGSIYYYGISHARDKWNFYNISALNLGEHGGYGYCFIVLLGDLLFHNSAIGVMAINLILALITIFAFYNIVRKKIQKSNFDATLFTAIFAFSPFVYGMFYDINLEFPQLCFFTWLIMACMYDKKEIRILSGILLIFTKETAVLLYASYCFGCFIFLFVRKREKFLKKIFVILTCELKIELLNGIVWLIFYVLFRKDTWTQTTSANVTQIVKGKASLNTFSFWSDYIIFKLKEMFVFNGMWIISAICCLLFIYCIAFKKKLIDVKKNIIFWGGLFAFVSFVFIQFFYVTWTNYRYLSVFSLFYVIVVITLIDKGISRKMYRNILLIILISVSFISNYYVLDPISHRVFVQRNIENNSVPVLNLFSSSCVNTNGNSSVIVRTLDQDKDKYTGARDCLFYNRQSSYVGEIFNIILADIDYDEDTLIVVPNIFFDKESTCNAMFYRDTYVFDNEYIRWNSKGKYTNLNTYRDSNLEYDDKENVIIKLKICDSLDEIKTIKENYTRVFCIYPLYKTGFNVDLFLSDMNIVSKKTYKKNIYKYETIQLTDK